MAAMETSDTFIPRYLSRDVSWVDFNERVLEEGLRHDLLPLDRYKYLSIVSSNFDEFFMVRVAAIKRAKENSADTHPAVFDPDEEQETITRKVRSIIGRQYRALKEEIFPELAQGGLCFLSPADWSSSHREFLESLFLQEYLPLLTPLRVEDDEPLPAIENLLIHAAFLLEDEQGEKKTAIVRIPPVLDRIIHLLPESLPNEEKSNWALLEDIILTWGDNLFTGYKVLEKMLFKINRDADFSVDEQRDEDFIEAMEKVLEDREISMVVRMSYSPGSTALRDYLASRFGLEQGDLYEIDGPLNLGNLHGLTQIRGFDHLREKPWKIYDNPAFPEDVSIWDRITQGDVFLHLPYQSFDPVLRFFREAATDPQVISIKTTLYRTSNNSPIIRALEQASLAGKHVTAVVELKARFNEKQNISWANRLEKAGVIVVYGMARLKIHAKAAVVIRRENERLKRYVHLSTGNYNETTARIYEDISLFTAREDIAYDTGLFFNTITGYSVIQSMRRLAIAPSTLKGRLLYLIEREINQSSSETPGMIIAKMNALADTDIINALYRASRAGVEILLLVRGICLLIPGVPEMSEHIQVISIIDHYLEHSRICYFANGGNDEIYLSSADWMPRNLERRVELMFPILEENTKRFILEILSGYFQDNTHTWFLDSQGAWYRMSGTGEEPFRAQTRFLAMADKAASLVSGESLSRDNTGFIIRRKPPMQNL
ncbi:MAG: polyphosphate kinase 1 [Treponema sp.]|jgi:polyphosphate kinase|nr:polyphosphate kinase 1 [Treponema sp.]